MARPRINHESILRIKHMELQDLTIFQMGVLIKLASIAAVSPHTGYVCNETGKGMTLDEIAAKMGTARLSISKNVEYLQNKGFIVFTDNGISITNWSRWFDTKAVYQREFMRRKRNTL